MNIENLFRQTYNKLKSLHLEQPHLEASWLIEKYAHVGALTRIKFPQKQIDESVMSHITKALERRARGEPLAYIFNEKEFFGRKFFVNRHVLIPRPETELLVEWAIEWAHKNLYKQPINILDLGAGSGCIGLTLLKELSFARLTALDKSSEALIVAKQNAKNLELENSCEFVHMDAALAANLLKRYDLVVANPPYISPDDINIEENVKMYEPTEALFCGEDGMQEMTAWLKAMPNVLTQRSAVCFEIGYNQGARAINLFNNLNIFSRAYLLKDYAKHDRVICGEIL
ncbi:MAG: protein-(glutamine-N5) methyltransferase, release factor-specific [Bdellovibrionales bacterium RBG_16_40_8]|nr:MAG: protein-(glutamine-N5) methyltransferase, release factor-specific [Bdellovibrionales bacterium RBG_16_40_8]